MASRTRNFFLNFISLTATTLIIRGVGVAFNVYVSNKAGAEAMGLFSLLGGIYAFAVTLGCAGINLGTTRRVAEAMGAGNKELAIQTAKRALSCAFVSSLAATILLFCCSDVIGEVILGDIRVVMPLRILSISLVPVALCSCLSGYFTAVRRVRACSAIQIAVQGIKIIATMFFLSRFIYLGAEYACTALVLGSVLSEFISLCASYLLYRIDKKRMLGMCTHKASYNGITKGILSITVPVTVSACARSGLTTIQHILIPKGLRASGNTWSSALAAYGTLHSMVMPLILFPSAFITSFSGLLISEVSECQAQNDKERLRRIAYRILTLSLIFSIGVSGMVIFFSRALGLTVYKSEEAAYYIKVMAPLIPIMYIDSAVDAILKGTGHEIYSMNVNIADALTACIFALVLIPRMGLMGYVISIYATEILNTFLSLIKMVSVTKMKFKIFHQILMPVLCILGATNCAYLVLRAFSMRNSILELSVYIFVSIFFYIAFLYATNTIGKEEKEVITFALGHG